MNTTHELTPAEQQPQNSAVAIIREAIAAGKSPETLSALLAVRREWEADEARKAYNKAVADFQRRAPIIEKADKAYDKAYARMDRIWREIRPLLTELGLSVTWQVCELRGEGDKQLCHIEGQLRHRDGHGEKLVQDIPMPDTLKGQNQAQRMGSASTYARRYAMTSALGLVTGDDIDDDGHAAGTHYVTTEQSREIADLLDACRGVADFKEDVFWKWVGVTSKVAADIPANRYGDVVAQLKKKLGGK